MGGFKFRDRGEKGCQCDLCLLLTTCVGQHPARPWTPLGWSWGGMRALGSRPGVGRGDLRGNLRRGVRSGAESWGPSMKPWARPRH